MAASILFSRASLSIPLMGFGEIPDLEVIKDLIRGFAREGLDPVGICHAVSRYLARERAVRLPLAVRLRLWVRGYCPIITLRASGWGPLTFCLVRCERHGLVLDYPHGYEGYFICPLCEEERRARLTRALGDEGAARKLWAIGEPDEEEGWP